jgi:H+/gluconate symporter-like permease
VWFIILIVLLELLFVGVPVAIFAGVGFYIWWMRLSEEEKKEFKSKEKKAKKKKHGGSGCGCVMFIALCIYIAINGNFNTKFANLSYSYFIYSMLYTVMWILIILGIPAAIILLIVYLTVWRKKSE